MELSCIIIDDEEHAISEAQDLIEITPGLKLTRSFGNVTDAINFLREFGEVDIIFSDISMPNIDGIEAGKILNAYCSFLIYITAHRHYTEDAFGVWASGYLLKPLSRSKFIKEIDQVFAKKNKIIRLDEIDNILFVKGSHKNSFIRIEYNNIIYISSMLNYVNISTIHGMKVTYMGLKSIEKKLANKNKFFRISKTKIISLDYLDHIDGNRAYLTDGQHFDIGAGYRDAFLDFMQRRTLNP